MVSDDEAAMSTLGDRLLESVRSLWAKLNKMEKVTDHHGKEIEEIKKTIIELKKEIHGLKISRGRARAKAERAEQELQEIETRLN